MKKKKKTNPNRIPLSEAHIRQASKQVYQTVMRDAMTLFLSALWDKEGMIAEDIQRIYAETESIAESVSGGYCTMADLRRALKEEANITFVR